MEYLFKKSIGPYMKGKSYKIKPSLAKFYLTAQIVQPVADKPAIVAAEVHDELSVARKEYQELKGKRPFHGWTVEQIKEKMKESD